MTIEVDAAQSRGPLKPIWRFFGADEPNYATMPDGRRLLEELGKLGPSGAYFRAHNLLTTGDGTPSLKWGSTNAYTEDAHGNPVYSWTIVDGILDAYLKSGLKPYVEIGFMPEAMSTRPEPYQHHWALGNAHNELFTGWAYPPRDLSQVGRSSFTGGLPIASAAMEKRRWKRGIGEVWNEPNIGYWKGTPEEFRKTHDYAVAGVRRALPSARVGGPDVAGDGGDFTRAFLEHCLRGTNYATGRIGTPIDFISFHAKGAPSFLDGHVRMGIANQLRTIDDGFALIASYPEPAADPNRHREPTQTAAPPAAGPVLGYRNTPSTRATRRQAWDASSTSPAKHGVNLEGALTWAFEFENQPYFAGFRTLSTRGIDLPEMDVFRMFGKMAPGRVGLHSSNAANLVLRNGIKYGSSRRPDVSGLASVGEHRLTILLWHYHDDDVAGPEAEIGLSVANLPVRADALRVTQYRIDEGHSNAFPVWVRMGSPQAPTPDQVARLQATSKLATIETRLPRNSGKDAITLGISLPRQAVALLQLDWD